MMSQKETESIEDRIETPTEQEPQIPAIAPDEAQSLAIAPEPLNPVEPVANAPILDPSVEPAPTNEAPRLDEPETSETKPKEKRNHSMARRLGGLIILIVLGLLLLSQCNQQPDEEPAGPVIGDGAVNSGGLNMKGYDEIKAGLQSQVDASYMNFKINLHPVFESPTGVGNLMIENTESNPYAMVVNIFLCDELGNPTDLVYASPILTPDQSISEDKLTEALDAGTYQALAMFMVLEEDNKTLKSQSGMRIQLTVEP